MVNAEGRPRKAKRVGVAALLALLISPGILGVAALGVSAVTHVHWLVVVGLAFVATTLVRRWVTFPLLFAWLERRSGAPNPSRVRWSGVVAGVALFAAIVVGFANPFSGARILFGAAFGTSFVLNLWSWRRKKTPRNQLDALPSEVDAERM